MSHEKPGAHVLVMLCCGLSACFHVEAATIPDGKTGSLVVIAFDSAAKPRQSANVYFAEDPRITYQTVLQRQAGAWTDERGVASLGSWRPGRYTLIVHAIGFKKEVRPIIIRAGQTDTLRISLRLETLLLQASKQSQ
ncbi:MAG: carboxypeptidase regulatory-like domain-containing protein [Gemmatimonadaceae bacterium]|nr:carboxypeptidase regulatory-like domain-containing protein [Gemmatimonadaceae bacterium]